MIGLAYQAIYRFFTVFMKPLNKGERDQPPPPDVERAHLLDQLNKVDERAREMAERRAKVDRK